MALKVLHLFSFICLLITLLPLLSHANLSIPKEDISSSSSPFQFINNLNGAKKGDNTKGLQKVKNYLQHFGYLQTQATDDEFDNLLESAIKLYQQNFHLNVTGTLDANTVSTMMMPRCGVPDIINGTNWMQTKLANKLNHRDTTSIQTGSYYTFFPGSPKWPPSKYHLTYAFQTGTRKDAFKPMAQAFQKWARVSRFTFTKTEDIEHADIKIGFLTWNHGDGSDFDGAGGILAHSFGPIDGRLHFDAAEHWGVGKVPGAFDIGTVGLHELGHSLGLGHSNVGAAIMWPSIGSNFVKDLNADDIEGLKALYHF